MGNDQDDGCGVTSGQEHEEHADEENVYGEGIILKLIN